MNEQKLRKLRLAILGNSDDSTRDELIILLSDLSEAAFRTQLNRAQKACAKPISTEIPADLEWIPFEVTVKRYNRLGSEGFQSESVEGHSITVELDAFAEYAEPVLDYYRDAEDFGRGSPGRVKVW